ncbi:hypothetical protein KG089_00590 [Carnobacteriaceae bacterium zg-ZUI252]|nr:hypothetical protein [Carnobacteriaceae bacterium zg-ZUI252]
METLVMPMNYVELQEDEMMYLDGARFYMSNDDLKAGIFAFVGSAASAGPVALMSAWTALTTMTLGPLGTVGSIGAALLGASFFADLALKITGAMNSGKGIALYPKWGWPPFDAIIE